MKKAPVPLTLWGKGSWHRGQSLEWGNSMCNRTLCGLRVGCTTTNNALCRTNFVGRGPAVALGERICAASEPGGCRAVAGVAGRS
jgi:hypothetical protein